MEIRRMKKRIITIALSAMMIFAMMPVLGSAPYAAAGGGGGVVRSDSAEDAASAFGGAVTASYSGKTLTIILNTDITLSEPVVFEQGSVGDTIVLRLNGHKLTGAAGSSGAGEDAAYGRDAVRVIPAMFNVEIQGPGSVSGGSGAVCKTEMQNKYGTDGGMAVCIAAYDDGSYWHPEGSSGRLEYGLKITKGAVLTGGDGADLSADDLLYNIENYTGGRGTSSAAFNAGNGGAGIGQHVNGITSGDQVVAYSKIEVESASVSGGAGGTIDLAGITPTVYAIMQTQSAARAMQGQTSNYYFARQVLSMMMMNPGNGGDGIMAGEGRKYICIASGGHINGGISGSMKYGSNKYINNLSSLDSNSNEACGGSGISVNAGDTGLTDSSVQWSGIASVSKSRDSDDMGIYIAGTVKGGDGADTDALNENAGNAGAGLYMNGNGSRYQGALKYMSSDYNDFKNLGIVEVADGGSVTGGNGGNSVAGSGGSGGAGINEYYERDEEGPERYAYGTDYYIVNGSVSGGSGGNSMHISAGTGGDGFTCKNYRDYLNIAGSGNVSGGDSGTEAVRSGESGSGNYKPEAVHIYSPGSNNVFTAGMSDGNAAVNVSKGTFNVTASMTSFSKNPSSSTKVSCSVSKPSGYTGGMYIQWYAPVYENSIGSNNGVTGGVLESASGNYTSFNLLSNSQYKYLAWPTYSNSTLNMNNYAVGDLSTADMMSEDGKAKTEIYCVVMLEDGRWGKSNVMSFTKGNGWNAGSSTGGTGSSDGTTSGDTETGGSDAETSAKTTYALSKAKISGISNKNYTGKALKQSVKVVLGGVTLKSGTDYTVTYKNNTRVGTATVYIKGKGKYTGTVNKTFTIGPKSSAISKLKPAKKAITVKWKKISDKPVLANGKKSNITGYQIQYSTNSKFAKGNKTVNVKGFKKTSKKLKLNAKTVYYVRIRTYIRTGGKTYYSTWSGAKSTRTK